MEWDKVGPSRIRDGALTGDGNGDRRGDVRVAGRPIRDRGGLVRHGDQGVTERTAIEEQELVGKVSRAIGERCEWLEFAERVCCLPHRVLYDPKYVERHDDAEIEMEHDRLIQED